MPINLTNNNNSLPALNKRLDNLEGSLEVSFGDVRDQLQVIRDDVDEVFDVNSKAVKNAERRVSSLERVISEFDKNFTENDIWKKHFLDLNEKAEQEQDKQISFVRNVGYANLGLTTVNLIFLIILTVMVIR